MWLIGSCPHKTGKIEPFSNPKKILPKHLLLPSCFFEGAINVDPPPSHYISKYRLMSPFRLGCWNSKKLAITIYAFKRNLNIIQIYLLAILQEILFCFLWKYNNYSHFYSLSMGISKVTRTNAPFLTASNESWGVNSFNPTVCLKIRHPVVGFITTQLKHMSHMSTSNWES